MSTGCSNIVPPIDLLCADPAYRAAHPDLCKNFTLLILSPDYSIKAPGQTVTYVVKLRANGKEEVLTKGLTWSTSNMGAAMINDLGVATAVSAGQASISVTWQNLSAQAQIDVVASCADTHQNFLVLIDNSKSMGQSFSSTYPTKLAFSKSIAAQFADTIDYSKDKIAVAKFNDAFSLLAPLAASSAAAKAAINSISTSTAKTNLAGALESAIASFAAQTGTKVIVLFTDGEWSGEDPKPIAQSFRESGGFLVIVATSAWGAFFVDLLEMASAGFLFSAYDATEASALATLSGLKSFLCSGSCSPEPGTAPTAQLNYTGFINWDVTSGRVDLVGLGVWDVRPGNGLYVDLQGTDTSGTPAPGADFGLGQLTSKVDYNFVNGKNYRFTLSVGGSLAGHPGSAGTSGTWTIRVRVGNGLDELITITSGVTPLTPHIFNWTQSGAFSGPIIIEQTVQTGHHNVGTCIDEITLLNVTDAVTMLYDNFDSENPVVVPPNPGYYGCAESPPGSQTSDPTPTTPRVVE